MSYVSSIYHIVLVTHRREMTIIEEKKEELYFYLWGIIKRNNCKLIRMNGLPDHIHLLLELSTTVSLSQLVRDLKRSSSIWLKNSNKIPQFKGWSKEYAAFSCSFELKDRTRQYIMNQQSHHLNESTDEEYKRMLESNGLRLFEDTNQDI